MRKNFSYIPIICTSFFISCSPAFATCKFAPCPSPTNIPTGTVIGGCTGNASTICLIDENTNETAFAFVTCSSVLCSTSGNKYAWYNFANIYSNNIIGVKTRCGTISNIGTYASGGTCLCNSSGCTGATQQTANNCLIVTSNTCSAYNIECNTTAGLYAAKGWYISNYATPTCTQCPAIADSNPAVHGTTDVLHATSMPYRQNAALTDCYIPKNTEITDSTGTYIMTEKCSY